MILLRCSVDSLLQNRSQQIHTMIQRGTFTKRLEGSVHGIRHIADYITTWGRCTSLHIILACIVLELVTRPTGMWMLTMMKQHTVMGDFWFCIKYKWITFNWNTNWTAFESSWIQIIKVVVIASLKLSLTKKKKTAITQHNPRSKIPKLQHKERWRKMTPKKQHRW